MRLVARLRPDPLGELTALPLDPLAGLKGEGKERGKREGEEIKKPEDPQCLKCVYTYEQLQAFCSFIAISLIFDGLQPATPLAATGSYPLKMLAKVYVGGFLTNTVWPIIQMGGWRPSWINKNGHNGRRT